MRVRSLLQHECQIFIGSKISLSFLLLLFLSPVASDNSGLDEQISENPPNSCSPLSLRYASCRVVLPLMCEITEGSGGHMYQHTPSHQKRPHFLR